MLSTVYGVYLVPILGMTAGGACRFCATDGRKPRRNPLQSMSKKGQKLRLACSFCFAASPAVRWSFGTIVLLAGGGVAAVSSLDAEKKAQLAVHNFACRRMWPEVLAALTVPEQPLHDERGQSGPLPQRPTRRRHVPICPGARRSADHRRRYAVMYWHVFDTLIELGLANRAENNLTECLEVFGEQPWILERLATINEIKGRTAAARIFWGAMRGTLFHDDLARASGSRVSMPIRTPPMSRPFGVYGSRLRRRMYPLSSTPRK